MDSWRKGELYRLKTTFIEFIFGYFVPFNLSDCDPADADISPRLNFQTSYLKLFIFDQGPDFGGTSYGVLTSYENTP